MRRVLFILGTECPSWSSRDELYLTERRDEACMAELTGRSLHDGAWVMELTSRSLRDAAYVVQLT